MAILGLEQLLEGLSSNLNYMPELMIYSEGKFHNLDKHSIWPICPIYE